MANGSEIILSADRKSSPGAFNPRCRISAAFTIDSYDPFFTIDSYDPFSVYKFLFYLELWSPEVEGAGRRVARLHIFWGVGEPTIDVAFTLENN